MIQICLSDILWSLDNDFAKKTGPFMGNLSENMIKHISELELQLYIILSTLEMFERWNRTVFITKYQWIKW